MNILDQIYLMQEVPKHSPYSKEFDEEIKPKKEKNKYIPPMSHPWKQDSYLRYLAKQKHRNCGANV